MNNKEKALKLACEAYSELVEAGISEEFIPLMISIAQANKGTFFGSFGSDSGCFIEFENVENSFTPVRLCFGIRRYKQSWWSRVKQILKEGRATLCGYDSEHEILLRPNDVAQLKDLLKVI